MFSPHPALQRCHRALLPTLAIVITTAACERAAPTLDALWLSDGYGLLAEIDGTNLTPYEVTAISCVRSDGELTLGTQESETTWGFALDEIFTEAADARGLILDVRKNYGGSDILSLALASRLAAKEYLAYAKMARIDPDEPERRTSPQERYVQVSWRPGFRGPVIQLIGPYTISAGETLTQALMGREPPIVRVGENTQGYPARCRGSGLS